MADRMFDFRLDGIEAMIGKLDKFESELEKRIAEELNLTAWDIVHDARELAPWLTGDLIGGIVRDEVKKTGDTMYVDIGVSPEIPYAVRMHEDFYNPGEKTRTSPVNSPRVGDQQRGRKYLERALKANEKPFAERLSKILEKG